jgi:hypothetical protein
MKKFIATLAVLTAISTPAFAQSFCACDGTGSVLPFSHKGTELQNDKIAVSQSALRAYAAVPGVGSMGIPNPTAATGGGSLGYNEMLRNY